MEQHNVFQDWELLQSPDAIPAVASVASRSGINHDYFVVGSDEKVMDDEMLGSKSLSWVEPNMDLAGHLTFQVSSDDQESPVQEGEKEVSFEEGSGVEAGDGGAHENWSDLNGNGRNKDFGVADIAGEIESKSGNPEDLSDFAETNNPKVGFNDVEDLLGNLSDSSLNNGGDVRKQEAEEEENEEERSGVSGIVEEIDSNNSDSKELGYVDQSDSDQRTEFSGERSAEKSNSGNLPVGNGNRTGIAWWKMHLELVKLCVFKIRPVWSLSIAAALMGFVMLTRRWYRMKRMSRSILPDVGIADKKASRSVARAARLNEAFSAMRRAPLLKASLPVTGVTPWPAMALR